MGSYFSIKFTLQLVIIRELKLRHQLLFKYEIFALHDGAPDILILHSRNHVLQGVLFSALVPHA
jgi:hypothetical protein